MLTIWIIFLQICSKMFNRRHHPAPIFSKTREWNVDEKIFEEKLFMLTIWRMFLQICCKIRFSRRYGQKSRLSTLGLNELTLCGLTVKFDTNGVKIYVKLQTLMKTYKIYIHFGQCFDKISEQKICHIISKSPDVSRSTLCPFSPIYSKTKVWMRKYLNKRYPY
jgi:hypothetical protein